MRTSNPALSDRFLQNETVVNDVDKMTLMGTVNKSFMLLGMTLIGAAIAWSQVSGPWGVSIPGWYFPVMIGTFVLSLVIMFKNSLAPVLAPIYAITEGLLIGTISSLLEVSYPGLIIQAVSGTFGVFLAMLIAYRSGYIKATENFKLGVVAATMGIGIMYIIDIALNAFAGRNVPLIHESSPIGIGFSLFVVGIAALNLVMDFDYIEKTVERGAPKYMEWYGAFSLLITLIWLYLEMLRLISKLSKK
jgi:uncharacterized YccA/Bax inhibitor family protein